MQVKAKAAVAQKGQYRFRCRREFRAHIPKDGRQLWGKIGPDAPTGAFYSTMLFEDHDGASFYDPFGEVREANVTVEWDIHKRMTERAASMFITSLECSGIKVQAWVLNKKGKPEPFKAEETG